MAQAKIVELDILNVPSCLIKIDNAIYFDIGAIADTCHAALFENIGALHIERTVICQTLLPDLSRDLVFVADLVSLEALIEFCKQQNRVISVAAFTSLDTNSLAWRDALVRDFDAPRIRDLMLKTAEASCQN